MKSKIINYIRAGYPGLYLVSHEEQRVDGELKRIAQELKYMGRHLPPHPGPLPGGEGEPTPAPGKTVSA